MPDRPSFETLLYSFAEFNEVIIRSLEVVDRTLDERADIPEDVVALMIEQAKLVDTLRLLILKSNENYMLSVENYHELSEAIMPLLDRNSQEKHGL